MTACLNTAVAHLDAEARELTTAAGGSYRYQRCLVATGARRACRPSPRTSATCSLPAYLISKLTDTRASTVICPGATVASSPKVLDPLSTTTFWDML